jgi:hypothetical protein
MNNRAKTVLVLTVIILSTATISYGAKPENSGKPENNLPALLNQVSDLLKEVIEGFQTLNGGMNDIEQGISDLQKSTDTVSNKLEAINGNLEPSKSVDNNTDEIFIHEKNFNYSLTASTTILNLNITCDKPYEIGAIYLRLNDDVFEIGSLGLSYLNPPYYLVMACEDFYNPGAPLRTAEVLSAIGLSNRPIASANDTFKLTCLLFVDEQNLPDGDEELQLRIMVLAPKNAEIECVQTDELA